MEESLKFPEALCLCANRNLIMKKSLIILFLSINSFLISTKIIAQDFLLSQPWSSPTFVGPSFAGLSGSRAYMTYRNQWASLKGSQTLLASFDHYYHPLRSSFGAVLSYTSYGGNMLSQTEFEVQYNFVAKITDEWFFRPGVEIGFFYRAMDPSKLIFVDQIALDGSVVPTSSFNPDVTSVLRLDASVSFLVYNEYIFVGAGADRLVPNDIAFTDAETETKIKLNAYAAGKIPFNGGYGKYDSYDDLTIAGLFQTQGQYQQFDIDFLYHHNPFMAGIGYRGIPFISSEGLSNTDALKFALGYSFENNITVSYSYDVSLSSLIDVSGGSHEIVLSYKFNQKSPNDRSFFCY